MDSETERNPAAEEVETPEGVGIDRAKQIIGELVNRAGYGGERIVILRNRKPVAVLVGLPDLERLRSTDAA